MDGTNDCDFVAYCRQYVFIPMESQPRKPLILEQGFPTGGQKWPAKPQKVALDLSKNKNEKLQKLNFTGYRPTEIIVTISHCKLY